MISFTTAQPLKKAVESFSARTPMGTALRSAELETLPQEIKKRAFWSATVESEKLLAEMQGRIAQRIQLARDEMADGSEGRVMNRRRFIDEMVQELSAAGYVPPEGREGSLQDLSSERRLQLIWDMNMAQAQGAAAWKNSTSEVALLTRPVLELVRIEERQEPRDWPRIWEDNGGKFFGGKGSNKDYPDAPGRMMAKVTDPIFIKINRFGVPWRPFDWGSGIGTRSVRRREALELGVITEDEPPQVAEPLDLNTKLESSVKGLSESNLENLRSELGDSVKISDATAVFNGGDVQELPARAAEIFNTLEEETDLDQALLARLAAVGTGRLRVVAADLPAERAQSLRNAITKAMPEAEVEISEGQVAVWRPDLTGVSPSRLMEIISSNPALTRILSGEGLITGKTARVVISDEAGREVARLDVPEQSWRVYANARTRDLRDATGKKFTFELEKGGAK